ncbi:MAG: hypothetical protein VX920_03955, partial [Pseudomonadota bacterium]|nr:hypothetical protein [Pseudomonadota bacterium]
MVLISAARAFSWSSNASKLQGGNPRKPITEDKPRRSTSGISWSNNACPVRHSVAMTSSRSIFSMV